MAKESKPLNEQRKAVVPDSGNREVSQAEEAFLGDREGSSGRKEVFGIERATAMMGLMFLGGIGWVLFASQQVSIVMISDQDDPNVMIVESGLADINRLASPTQDQDEHTRRLMDAIYYGAKQRQIPPDDIRSNPFTYHFLPEPKAPEPEPDVPEAPPEPESAPENPPPVAGLSLQSVLMGANPTAMISGTLVRRGQIIQGWKVVEIQQDRVKLMWRNRVYWLKMP